MNVFLKGLIALIVGAIVAAIAEAICRHMGIDDFWGWLVGVIVGLLFFFNYESPRRPL